LFVNDLGATFRQVRCFGRGGSSEPIKFVMQHATQCVPGGRGDLDALVVLDDEVFDVPDQDPCLGAVGAFLVTVG